MNLVGLNRQLLTKQVFQTPVEEHAPLIFFFIQETPTTTPSIGINNKSEKQQRR